MAAHTMDYRGEPPNFLLRIYSLLQVGPIGILLRLIDQGYRKLTGTPFWSLSRVTPQLYVGGQQRRKGWQAMEAEGITAVLNMREQKHDDVANGVGGERHLHLPTRDNTPVPFDSLEAAADFIHEEIENGGKVYVHCGVGVGRAPSAAASYFIKHHDMSAMQALATIRDKRPFIHLTAMQRLQLEAWEVHLREQGTHSHPIA